MRKLLLSCLAALVLLANPAFAQNLSILPSGCGTGAFGTSTPYLTVDSTGRLCTYTSIVPSGTQDVNIAQVAGATVATGHGTAAGAMRVELPTDGTGVVGLNAGSAIIGKVAVDQTTPGTTNGVQVNAALPAGTNNIGLTVPAVSSASTAGAAPVSSSALAANTVIKASAGNLYSFQVAADSTLSAAAWWIMIYNATSAPVDGAVTPAKCYAMPAGSTTLTAAFPTPLYLGTGITIGVSTNGCFTKAASTHAFISGDAQ